MTPSTITHDRLQQDCWMWLYNSYPVLRKKHWAVINSIKPFPGETQKAFQIRIGYLKAIGMTPGVLDMHFYHKGILHVFDFKIDNDCFSQDQLDFIAAVESEGAKSYEIRSLTQFQTIIKEIV